EWSRLKSTRSCTRRAARSRRCSPTSWPRTTRRSGLCTFASILTGRRAASRSPPTNASRNEAPGMTPIPAAMQGARLLSAPAWNKGTAFTIEERARFGLHGLLPPYVETLDEQVARAYTAYCAYDKPMNRHIYLRQLQDNNEVLFYRLLL